MADSGDGPSTTSSGKEGRNTVIDGPVTDPAVSTKVKSLLLILLRKTYNPRIYARYRKKIHNNTAHTSPRTRYIFFLFFFQFFALTLRSRAITIRNMIGICKIVYNYLTIENARKFLAAFSIYVFVSFITSQSAPYKDLVYYSVVALSHASRGTVLLHNSLSTPSVQQQISTCMHA